MKHKEPKKGAIGQEAWEKRLQEIIDKIPDGVIKTYVLGGRHSGLDLPLGEWIPLYERRKVERQVFRCEHCLNHAALLFNARLTKAKDRTRNFGQIDKCKSLGVWIIYLKGRYSSGQEWNLERHLQKCEICGPIVRELKKFWIPEEDRFIDWEG